MSRNHPSWPHPLLALAPIRLRPMGWLDDLLPLRPPSLWRDRSIYARGVQWQPEMADLSWLFAAYSMLGVELPAQRIEHRTHQRTQRSGRFASQGGKPTHLRRQRAPVKSSNKPLVVPQWASSPSMRGPGEGKSAERVDMLRPKRTPNIPQYQWRSPSSPNQPSMAPNLASAPAFLRKDSSLDQGSQAGSKAPVEKRIREKERKEPTLLSEGRGKVSKRSPVAPSTTEIAGKSSGKLNPASTRATPPRWRLNAQRQAIFGAAKPTEASESVSTPRLRRVGTVHREGQEQDAKGKVHSIRRQVQQVEWHSVRQEEGVVSSKTKGMQTVQPPVVMDLPPSPQRVEATQESSKRKEKSISSEVPSSSSPKKSGGKGVLPTDKPSKDLTEAQSTKRSPSKSLEATVGNVPSKKGKVAESSVVETGAKSSKSTSSVEREDRQTQSKPAADKEVANKTSRVESVVFEGGRLLSRKERQGDRGWGERAKVRREQERLLEIAKRQQLAEDPRNEGQPWRLRRVGQSLEFRGASSPMLAAATEGRTPKQKRLQPIAESVDGKRTQIPKIASWFRPQRQRLIAHFQQQSIAKARHTRLTAPDGVNPVTKGTLGTAASVEPLYNFGATPTSVAKTKGLRSSIQSMVSPIQAGTMVFPTPSLDNLAPQTRPKTERSAALESKGQSKQDASQSISSTKKKGSKIQSPEVPTSKQKSRKPTAEIHPENRRKSIEPPEVEATQSKAIVGPKGVEPRPDLDQRTSTEEAVREETPKRKTVYPEAIVQKSSGYQRRHVSIPRSVYTAQVQWNERQPQSLLTKTLQQRSSTERTWHKPYVRQVLGDIPTHRPKNVLGTSAVPTTVSNRSFRAPAPFWQGVQSNRVTVQLPTQMLLPAPDREVLSTTSKVKSEPQPDQVSTKRKTSAVRESKPVPSVSWSRKPSFPDPFLAHKRTQQQEQVALKSSSPRKETIGSETEREKRGQGSSLSPDTPLTSRLRSSETTLSVQGKKTEKTFDVDRSEVGKKSAAGSLQSPNSLTARGGTVGEGTFTEAVRRVVAPTLSAALVYNASLPSDLPRSGSAQKTPTSKSSPTSSIAPTQTAKTQSSSVSLSSPRKGKYGPTAKDPAKTKEGISKEASSEENLAGIAQSEVVQADERASLTPAQQEEIAERVEKRVEKLVKRLPAQQRSLLRAQISLPTNWAKKLGMAPTAEVRLGWTLQRSTSGIGTPTQAKGLSTPTIAGVSSQNFVVPGTASPSVSPSTAKREGTATEEIRSLQKGRTAQVAGRTMKQGGQETSSEANPSPRTLTSSQVNRIIERQVSFFRTAQRKSFLRASQMSGGASVGMPKPARAGVQQVAGEMRKALQQMVFSNTSNPIFLDPVSDFAAIESAVKKRIDSTASVEQTKTSPSAASNRQKTLSPRAKWRQPSWRPGVHAPTSLTTPSTQRGRTVANEANSAVLSTSVQPNLPVDSSTFVTGKPTAASDTPSTIQQKASPKTASPRVSTSTPNSRRSTPLAPSALMGKSEVGVFLRPTKKSPEQTEAPAQKNRPVHQKPDSVDRQSEVFMVDPSGKLLTGEAATKRLKEMGFARAESKPTPPPTPSTSSGSSYSWEAPPEVMADITQQVRREMAAQEQVVVEKKTKPRQARQSVIREWTEEQLLTILVELSEDSPEANALLRDVQERVEEIFDLDRFRRI